MAKRLIALENTLSAIFKAPKPKAKDTQRKFREKAKSLAVEHKIEIERDREGGMWVHCPDGVDPDPFEGDHYCCDWKEALGMVEQYVAELAKIKGDHVETK